MNGWQVIKTARFKENYVSLQLTQTGAEAYLPMVKIPKQSLRPGQSQLEPLFPGYLFVRVTSGAYLLSLRNLKAFHSVVCFGGTPASVADSVIDHLKRRERGRGYFNLPVPKEPLPLHGPVRVTEGPFSGQTGILLHHLDSMQRVCILLDALQSGVRVELPRYAVAV